ncbi:MAG: endonuclease domain-containing protein [Alphaproteobacteria bacterium]|nr:endonuclease domain-containing protein [Alphaproteobacteria bacterium]
MQYKEFIFEKYSYDPVVSTLSLRYRFGGGPRFEEKLVFEFVPRHLLPEESVVLDRIFRLIFLMSGVSYYKSFVPQKLICEPFPMDCITAEFLQKFYEKGLAEFAFRNRISLRGHFAIRWLGDPPPTPIMLDLPRRTCVPVGGGKDSIVTLECLKRSEEPLILFGLGDAEPIRACIAAAGLPFIRVHRRLDSGLFKLNEAGALNGHVPITGILSAIALAGALMAGCDAIVMSNEHSASAPNLQIDDTSVNHQYSKSLEFEEDFSEYLKNYISPSIAYFSLLRPLSEIEIARRFAKYRKYFSLFLSCNAVFRQSPTARGRGWCGNCPKCRFVFLALAPFIEKTELIGIFGRNLFDDETQRDGFAQLCGLREHKPFECVGELAESAAVMSYLGSHPDWREDAVVQQLHGAFVPLRQRDSADFRALFEVKHPHRVPDSYMAKLDACK